jgi:hypothetical protein
MKFMRPTAGYSLLDHRRNEDILEEFKKWPSACRKRRLKWVLGAWGYNWATRSPGDINMETWSSRLGVWRGADDPTLEKVNS